MKKRGKDKKELKKAFKNRDVQKMIELHEKGIEDKGSIQGKYLKSWVYGGLDGIITTFAIVAGVIGAGLSHSIILILGFANLIADGISMAIGDFISTKSESEYYEAEKEREKWEVEKNPSGEKKEMVDIYLKKGFNEKDAKQLTNILSKNKKFWIESMMRDELKLDSEKKSPAKNAIVTFMSFVLFGVIPLILFVSAILFNLKINNPFLLTSILAGFAMFSLGTFKTKITQKNILVSGSETLLIGGLAASAAYIIGNLLSSLV